MPYRPIIIHLNRITVSSYFYLQVSNITLVQGPQGVAGPPGLNGTQGPPGPPGLNLSSCKFKTNKLEKVKADLAKVYTELGDTLASQVNTVIILLHSWTLQVMQDLIFDLCSNIIFQITSKTRISFEVLFYLQNKRILVATYSMFNFHFAKLEYEKEIKRKRYKCTCFNRVDQGDAACYINFWECHNV